MADKDYDVKSPYEPSHTGPQTSFSGQEEKASAATEASNLTDDQPDLNQQGQPNEGSSFWRAFYADKKLFYSTVGAILFVLLGFGIIGYFLFWQQTPPPPADIDITLEKPSRIVTGQAFDMAINYHNRSDKNLENVELSLVYPLGYSFRQSNPEPANESGLSFKIGNLSGGQTKEVRVTGMIDGQVGDKKDLQITLSYKIEGFRVTYKTEKKESLEIGSPDLSMTMTGPSDATAGQVATYNVTYKNISDKMLRNINFALVAPTEFRITDTTPKIDGNNTWSVGDIAPGQEASFRIQGIYDLASSLQKAVEVTASEQGKEGEIVNRVFTVTKVSDSPILIRQTITGGDENVDPGETISYGLQVENRGSSTLTNLVVAATLDGPFNFSTLRTDGGVLADGTITWTPGGVSALKALRAGESVRINYSVRVSQNISPDNRTVTLTSVPSVTSFEIKEPIVGTALTLKMTTQVDHSQQVVYESGAWPMEVGKETRFRVNWQVNNSTNTITNARVTANLPLGANSYVSGGSSAGTSISFQSSAYSLVWDIGNMAPNAQATAYFIVAYRPSEADINEMPVLANNIAFSATDSFTGQMIVDSTPVGQARPASR